MMATTATTMEDQKILNMDLTAYSSVGTQTPTEDRTFEFPECFSPSPLSSRSSVSSIGTQTSVRQKSFESPETATALRSLDRPKLFRRHSTGSDVYNFSGSPTLMTAFGGLNFLQRGGGIFSRRMLPGDWGGGDKNNAPNILENKPGCEEPCDDDVESVGQQLRKIGDDFDRVGSFRSRSLSVVIAISRKRAKANLQLIVLIIRAGLWTYFMY